MKLLAKVKKILAAVSFVSTACERHDILVVQQRLEDLLKVLINQSRLLSGFHRIIIV